MVEVVRVQRYKDRTSSYDAYLPFSSGLGGGRIVIGLPSADLKGFSIQRLRPFAPHLRDWSSISYAAEP